MFCKAEQDRVGCLITTFAVDCTTSRAGTRAGWIGLAFVPPVTFLVAFVNLISAFLLRALPP